MASKTCVTPPVGSGNAGTLSKTMKMIAEALLAKGVDEVAECPRLIFAEPLVEQVADSRRGVGRSSHSLPV